MDLGCVVLAGSFIFIIAFLILDRQNPRKSIGRRITPTTLTSDNTFNNSYIQESGPTALTSTGSPQHKVKITGSDDLISWALHKHPADIEANDFINSSIYYKSDYIIHRDGGVNTVIKGPGKGRVLTDWEMDRYEK